MNSESTVNVSKIEATGGIWQNLYADSLQSINGSINIESDLVLSTVEVDNFEGTSFIAVD